MSDLLWPGSDRGGHHLTDAALLAAMLRVEVAWLDALVATGVAPAGAAEALRTVEPPDTLDGEPGGTPVIPLVAALRERLDEPAATWLHRGLTSQDVLDTALVLAARAEVADLDRHLRRLARACAALAERHRADEMAGRTLTQHAVPTTFGLVAAQWLAGVLDALDDLGALTFPVQLGGAVGTRAALVELAGPERAREVVSRVAGDLGLAEASPWHTVRTPITRIGDAVVRTTDACGHLATDVLVLARTEVGEVSEGTPGGSSTMPDKANPVLAALVRRAALTTPGLAAQLHVAAADSHDQRTAGAWHTEGAALRDLLHRAVVAVDQSADLVTRLQVHPDRMAGRAAGQALRGEQRSMAALAGAEPAAAYLGEADALVTTVLDRARPILEESP